MTNRDRADELISYDESKWELQHSLIEKALNEAEQRGMERAAKICEGEGDDCEAGRGAVSTKCHDLDAFIIRRKIKKELTNE